MRIDDLKTAVLDDIVHIAVQNPVRLKGLIDQMIELLVLCQVGNPEKFLGVLLPQCSEYRCFLPRILILSSPTRATEAFSKSTELSLSI